MKVWAWCGDFSSRRWLCSCWGQGEGCKVPGLLLWALAASQGSWLIPLKALCSEMLWLSVHPPMTLLFPSPPWHLPPWLILESFVSLFQTKCCFPEGLELLSTQLDIENGLNVIRYIRGTFTRTDEGNFNKYAEGTGFEDQLWVRRAKLWRLLTFDLSLNP